MEGIAAFTETFAFYNSSFHVCTMFGDFSFISNVNLLGCEKGMRKRERLPHLPAVTWSRSSWPKPGARVLNGRAPA